MGLEGGEKKRGGGGTKKEDRREDLGRLAGGRRSVILTSFSFFRWSAS